MIEQKDEIKILDDGAVVKDGRLLTAEEETAEAEQAVLLGDVLSNLSSEIAGPRIFSAEVEALLNSPDEPAKREAREARLRAINELLAKSEKGNEG